MHDVAQNTLRAATPLFADRAAVLRILDGLPRRPPAELRALEALLMALVSLALLNEHCFGSRAA